MISPKLSSRNAARKKQRKSLLHNFGIARGVVTILAWPFSQANKALAALKAINNNDKTVQRGGSLNLSLLKLGTRVHVRWLMIEGERIRLRGYQLTDMTSETECFNDYEGLKNYADTPPLPVSLDIEKLMRKNWSNPSKQFDWVIEGKKSNVYLGTCGYSEVDHVNSVARVNIFLKKAARGQGFANEAMALLLDYMFMQMNLHRIELNVFEFNSQSISLWEKLGFVPEGRLRKRVFRDGQYHDELWMGLLREEWRKAHPHESVAKK